MTRMQTAAIALLFGATAQASMAAEPLISEVDVVVELEDAENANALTYWPTIEQDMEAKFAAEIADQLNDSGLDVTVRLAEVSLDGSELLGSKGEFNTLKGWVYIREQNNPEPIESVGISLEGEIGTGDPDASFTIAPSIDDMYEALTTRFVERTMEEIARL